MSWIDENAAHQAERLRAEGAARWEKWFNGAFWEYQLADRHKVYLRQTNPPSRGTDVTEISPSSKEREMRGLFTVIIVDPETDDIIYEGKHIAADEGAAKMRAATRAGELPKDLDDLDVIALRLGNVRDREELQSQILNRTMLSYLGQAKAKAPELTERTPKAKGGGVGGS